MITVVSTAQRTEAGCSRIEALSLKDALIEQEPILRAGLVTRALDSVMGASNQADEATRSNLRATLREQAEEIQSALALPYIQRHAMRKEFSELPRSEVEMLNPELIARAVAYRHALDGARFVNVLDINGTVTDFSGAFYAGVREELEASMKLSPGNRRLYFVTGDTLDKVLSGLLEPEQIISRTSADRSSPLTLTGPSYWQQLSLITDAGLRIVQHVHGSNLFATEPLARGLPSVFVKILVSAIDQELDSYRKAYPIERFEEMGLRLRPGTSVLPWSIHERYLDNGNGVITVSAFGDLDTESRRKLAHPTTELKELLIIRDRLVPKLNEHLTLLSRQCNLSGGHFSAGGVASIDQVALDKGAVAEMISKREKNASPTRPIVCVGYGDQVQERRGNDNPLLQRCQLVFDVSGAQTAIPIEQAGKQLIYSPVSSRDGGTRWALSIINDAQRLSNLLVPADLR